MDDNSEECIVAVAAIARIEVVPALLTLLCDITGMRFAMVVAVTHSTWTACAVADDGHYGVMTGEQVAVNSAACAQARAARAPTGVESRSPNPIYYTHPALKSHAILGHLSAPIVLGNGRYFGELCALDPELAPPASGSRLRASCNAMAGLIASQLDRQILHEREWAALVDERACGELRDRFIAVLGHDLRNLLQAVLAIAAMLERKLAASAHTELAARIKVSAHRMSLLIDDVLDLARGRLARGSGSN